MLKRKTGKKGETLEGGLVNDPVPNRHVHHQAIGVRKGEGISRLLEAFELHHTRWEIFVQGSSMVVLDVVEVFLVAVRVVEKRAVSLAICANFFILLPILGGLKTKGV